MIAEIHSGLCFLAVWLRCGLFLLLLIPAAAFSGVEILRWQYKASIKEKASGTRRGGAHKSPSARTCSSRDTPPRFRSLPRGTWVQFDGFLKPMIYTALCFCAFCGGTLKSKWEKPQEKKQEQQQKKNPALEAFFISARYVPQGGQEEALGDDM